jgi:hypothetical protein
MNALGILLGSDAYTDCEQIWEVGNALVFAKSRKGFNVSNVEPCPENHTPPRADPSTLFSLSERGPISPGFNPGLTPGFNIRMEVCPESTSNPLRGEPFGMGHCFEITPWLPFEHEDEHEVPSGQIAESSAAHRHLTLASAESRS